MLPFYAARFPTVEINYTFYRMPTEKLVAGWAAQTPSPFKLTLKAPRRITHDSRLKNCGELVDAFCRAAGTLESKLGALLFQLPPTAKKGSGAVRCLPRGSAAERHGGVRVPAPLVARRRGVRPARQEKSRVVRGGQREDVHAGPCDGRLCVLPAARRRLHRGRHRDDGPRRSRATPRPAATCSSISSTRKKERVRSSRGC